MSDLASKICEIDPNKRLSSSQILELINLNQIKINEEYYNLINSTNSSLLLTPTPSTESSPNLKKSENIFDEFFDSGENNKITDEVDEEKKNQIISKIFGGEFNDNKKNKFTKEEIDKIFWNFNSLNLKIKKFETKIKELEEIIEQKNEENYFIKLNIKNEVLILILFFFINFIFQKE
jgi:serine/threonine protein kinase